MEWIWNKPVITFYKERRKQFKRKPFAVIKANKFSFSRVEEEKEIKFKGSIRDFFPLMGNIDIISSKKGISDRYVLCWFNDKEDDINKAWRRLTGVTFPAGFNFGSDKGKRIYNATFIAEYRKLGAREYSSPPKFPRTVSLEQAKADVKRLPKIINTQTINENINSILTLISVATHEDLPVLHEAFKVLRAQPKIVEVLVNNYKSLPKEKRAQRKILVQIIGELKLPEAFPFLKSIAWDKLPKKENSIYLNKRDREEILQTKAIQSIAFLREEHCFDELINVIHNHTSKAVRLAAIDAFMYNHGDSEEAETRLYKTLPVDMHRYVRRPRFHRGMDRQVFNGRLNAWLKKWKVK